MGSILTALRVKKPIIIFPRKASLNEHRNDHQLATSESFANVEGVYVAKSKDELFDLLNRKDELVSGVLNDSEEYIKLMNNLEKILGWFDWFLSFSRLEITGKDKPFQLYLILHNHSCITIAGNWKLSEMGGAI